MYLRFLIFVCNFITIYLLIMQKQAKAHPQGKIWYFSNTEEWISLMKAWPFLEKIRWPKINRCPTLLNFRNYSTNIGTTKVQIPLKEFLSIMTTGLFTPFSSRGPMPLGFNKGGIFKPRGHSQFLDKNCIFNKFYRA